MSTFDGVIKEFPYIRVDRFNNELETAKAFFLTHCHTDHMEGLELPEFLRYLVDGKYLYASPISVRILKNMYPEYERYLREIAIGESILLTVRHKDDIVCLNVRALPAGHCPGSVMFLFETKKKRVLCTGDFRIDDKDEFMNKYFKEMKIIDTIYLDTTFCKKEYAFFPSRRETLQGLCDLIDSWLDLDNKNVVQLNIPAHYGSEFLFMGISKKTKQIIHVSQYRYNLHKYIPDMDKLVDCVDDNYKTRIHACENSGNCKLRISNPRHVCTIKITAMIWKDYNIGDNIIKCGDGNFYRVCASYHASYNEICEFIEHLKPVKIVPCVLPDNEKEQKEMLELLDNMLHSNVKTKKKDCQRFVINKTDLVKVQSNNSPKRPKFSDALSSPPRKNTGCLRDIYKTTHTTTL